MKDLTQGSVTRHLLSMAAFMAVSMFVQTLYLLADLYWVGHLGKEAIAAVGVAGNLTMIVLAMTQMLSVGTTTLMSHAAGAKDQARAELVFNQSFLMSIVAAIACRLPATAMPKATAATQKGGITTFPPPSQPKAPPTPPQMKRTTIDTRPAVTATRRVSSTPTVKRAT